VAQAIRDVLIQPRERARIAADVHDMRRRIEAEKGTQDIWDLKQVRGGLVDLEFIVQYLQLIHAHQHPQILSTNTVTAYANLQQAGLLPDTAAEVLIPAARLLNNLTQILRLCVEGTFSPPAASEGLKSLLARAGEAPSFPSLEADLRARQAAVHGLFAALVA
jgi:glutamate-ammonia-ligase adenylyltransferase